MTATAGSPGRRTKAIQSLPAIGWASHYSAAIAAVLALLQLACDAAGDSAGILGAVASVASVTVGALICADMVHHRARLCERCIASVPLSPQESAEKWKFALWAFHSRIASIAGLSCIAAEIVASKLAAQAGWANWFTVAADAFLSAVFAAGWQHNKLAAWCPWCHWGDGGSQEVSPEVPDPALSK